MHKIEKINDLVEERYDLCAFEVAAAIMRAMVGEELMLFLVKGNYVRYGYSNNI